MFFGRGGGRHGTADLDIPVRRGLPSEGEQIVF